MPVLRDVLGRKHDFLVTASGQLVHPEFIDEFFSRRQEVGRYQVYQPDQNHLEVRLVGGAVSPMLLNDISSGLNARFGEAMEVSVCLVDGIPLTQAGKHRPIISDVSPEVK
jgi:hypothetical protein